MISGPNLGITAGFRLQRLLQQRTFASNSNFRRVKEEWPACSVCCDNDLPRPILFFVAAKKEWSRLQRPWRQRCPQLILIFVAAKKNSPPAASVATTIFRVRFYSSLLQRKWFRLQWFAATTFRVRFYSSLPQRRMARLLWPSPQRPSASDSNFLCGNREWFRLQIVVAKSACIDS